MTAFRFSTRPRPPEPYVLEFELVGLPKMANQLLRGHWRVKYAHTKKWKSAVADALRFQFKPPQPLVRAELTLIRVSSAEADFDGLVSGFKAIIDGLVECGVLKSDKPSCIGQPKYFWEKGQRGAGKVRIRVEEQQWATLESRE